MNESDLIPCLWIVRMSVNRLMRYIYLLRFKPAKMLMYVFPFKYLTHAFIILYLIGSRLGGKMCHIHHVHPCLTFKIRKNGPPTAYRTIILYFRTFYDICKAIKHE